MEKGEGQQGDQAEREREYMCNIRKAKFQGKKVANP